MKRVEASCSARLSAASCTTSHTLSLSRSECLLLTASFFHPPSLSLPHTLYPVVCRALSLAPISPTSHHWNVEDRSSTHPQRVASHAATHCISLRHTTIPLISPKSHHDPNFGLSPETVSISDLPSQARPTLVLSILRFQVSSPSLREIHLSLVVFLAFKLHFFRFSSCFPGGPLNIFLGFFIFLSSIHLVFSRSLILSLSLYFRSFAQAHTKTLVLYKRAKIERERQNERTRENKVD